MPSPDLSAYEDADDLEAVRRALYATQLQLRRAKAKTEDLVAATLRGAHDAMLGVGRVPAVPKPPADRRRGKPEVALWHLTDWQGHKVTTTYNSDVMRTRVMRYCDKASQLTEIQRAAHPVKHCVIMFGGDLAEGLFNYPTQPFEIDGSLFTQYVRVARLVADVVRRALGIYETVEVIVEWGNHGRIGNRRAVVPREDNLDRMIAELAREIVCAHEDPKRLAWPQAGADDIQRVHVGNYRALLIHGDEIGRNGYASPMTIVGHVAKWQSGSYPWEFRDCYMGHYHNHGEWSLPNGRGALYQTGATESDNRYARDTMAAAATPSQRLHFVDPRKGRVTAQYKVLLEDN